MKPDYPIVLLTGNQRRHQYAAGRLSRTCQLAGIVRETKYSLVKLIDGAAAQDQEVMLKHFRERDQVEARLLGDPPAIAGDLALEIAHGAIDREDVFEWVRQRHPRFLVLYGTSIIRGRLLREFSGRIVNLHLGLSPYYRGSGTNFWPLVNGEPECVGATLHLAEAKVDAGPILCQVRPSAEPADRIHELGTKTLQSALEVLPRLLQRLAADRVEARAQDLSIGRVYRRKDFSAAAVRRAWDNLDRGLIPRYLNEREARNQAFPIVKLGND